MTESAIDIRYPNDAYVSVVKSLRQALAPATTTASKLIVLVDDTLTTVGISNFTTANILEKITRQSGVDYNREIEPLYWTADLVERTKRRRCHIQSHEKRTHASGTPEDIEADGESFPKYKGAWSAAFSLCPAAASTAGPESRTV